ncbi:MAG: hypothetical protein ACJ79S_04740 [Gemmatimonadaceae bacterium]
MGVRGRLAGALVLVAAAGPVVAQEPTRPPADSARLAPQDSTTLVARNRFCNGQTVSSIAIDARRPNFGGASARWRKLARKLGLHHRTTREDIVRRFLALDVGAPCSELRRAESERILRAQPYLADARVRTMPDSAGGTRVAVETVDEVPVIVGAAFSRGQPSLLKVGNTNVFGTAIAAEAGWREGFFYRDGWSARVTDFQFAGRPYVLNLDARRQPLGGEVLSSIAHPYLTDLQRIAWRGFYGDGRDYVRFVRPDSVAPGDPSISVHREYWDVGALVRIGRPGRLSLFGLSLSRERESSDQAPFVVTDSGIVPDTAAELAGRYASFRAARLNALWGIRDIRFMTVRGFDALTAPQDVRRGFQLGTILGRSIPALGTDQDDIFVGGDLFAGGGSPRSYVGLEATGEGRQDLASTRWDGILTSGRLAWYFRLTPRHTLTTSSQFTGGWRQRVPFQLTLGDYEGGVRGYRGSRYAGAQRLLGTIEDRWYVGRFRQAADLGVAGFVEGGRIWAGDAPYGQTAGPKFAAGLGFLGTFGLRSKRVYRVDVGFPLSADRYAKGWAVRVSSRDFTHDFLREPHDLTRSRERTVPSSVFTWP